MKFLLGLLFVSCASASFTTPSQHFAQLRSQFRTLQESKSGEEDPLAKCSPAPPSKACEDMLEEEEQQSGVDLDDIDPLLKGQCSNAAYNDDPRRCIEELGSFTFQCLADQDQLMTPAEMQTASDSFENACASGCHSEQFNGLNTALNCITGEMGQLSADQRAEADQMINKMRSGLGVLKLMLGRMCDKNVGNGKSGRMCMVDIADKTGITDFSTVAAQGNCDYFKKMGCCMNSFDQIAKYGKQLEEMGFEDLINGGDDMNDSGDMDMNGRRLLGLKPTDSPTSPNTATPTAAPGGGGGIPTGIPTGCDSEAAAATVTGCTEADVADMTVACRCYGDLLRAVGSTPGCTGAFTDAMIETCKETVPALISAGATCTVADTCTLSGGSGTGGGAVTEAPTTGGGGTTNTGQGGTREQQCPQDKTDQMFQLDNLPFEEIKTVCGMTFSSCTVIPGAAPESGGVGEMSSSSTHSASWGVVVALAALGLTLRQ